MKRKETRSNQGNISIGGGADTGVPANQLKFTITAGGSRLKASDVDRTYRIDSMQTALDHLVDHKICLVIDDFHYLAEETREAVIRAVKGAVFRGLKLVLLSTPHRAFEAIKAEAEITGRFKHVAVPSWSEEDLAQIASTGFDALNVRCPDETVRKFASEAQGSPLLMQQFCWNLCYDSGIAGTSIFPQKVDPERNLAKIFSEVARDCGLPVYEKLAKGPQSRTERIPRPLTNGESVDIYQAILLAVAITGPRERLSYDQIRASLNQILVDKIPQKLEVSNALNHLAEIDRNEKRGERAIDWDGDGLDLVLNDPFFRFYLRWEIAPQIKPHAP